MAAARETRPPFFVPGTAFLITLNDKENRILETVLPEAESMGIEVVRVRLMGGRTPTLQFMIEKTDGPAGVEDCAKFSRALSPLLDVHDFVDGKYHLEVSTPGIDRPLTRPKDFVRWVGHLAKVELKMPLESGRRRFTGELTSTEEGIVKLLLEDETELEAEFGDISKSSLVLTEELISAAEADGLLMPDPEEGEFDEIEQDGDDPETDEEEENS